MKQLFAPVLLPDMFCRAPFDVWPFQFRLGRLSKLYQGLSPRAGRVAASRLPVLPLFTLEFFIIKSNSRCSFLGPSCCFVFFPPKIFVLLAALESDP